MAKQDEKAPADRLIDLLGSATPADLAALDAKIAAKRAEIDQLLAGHKAELGTLEAVRGFLARKLGVEPAKKRGGPRKKAAEPGAPPRPAGPNGSLMHPRRVSVARLLGQRGPLAMARIGEELEIPMGSMSSVMNCDWFEQTPQGYRLTVAGRRESGIASATA